MNVPEASPADGSANPYTSTLAYAHSSYMSYIDGTLVRALDWRELSARARLIHGSLRSFIRSCRYPCVGARASINAGHYRLGIYREMGSAAATVGLARDLWTFVTEPALMRTGYATFIAIFDDVHRKSEEEFEKILWVQLQALHDIDRQAYDPAVSSNPESPNFAFSFAGKAFFVVGMHPGSSRLARRFPSPALVFNSHSQFDALRRKGIYERVLRIVRSRDLALQGSLNPNLAPFGERSEAGQYAGRAVDGRWKCPFQP